MSLFSLDSFEMAMNVKEEQKQENSRIKLSREIFRREVHSSVGSPLLPSL